MSNTVAIFLSVNEYKHFEALRYCHADAEKFLTTLESYSDLERSHLHHIPLNLKATMEETFSKIHAKIHAASPAIDKIIFYFAGHGLHYTKNRTSYLLLPQSVPERIHETSISLPALGDVLRKTGATVFRIFDACHSGQFTRNNGPVPPPSASYRSFLQDLRVEESDWITLAACGEDEASHECSALKHGAFTYYLMQAIREHDLDQPILMHQLRDSVVQKLKRWHGNEFRQNPILIERSRETRPLAHRIDSPLIFTLNDDLPADVARYILLDQVSAGSLTVQRPGATVEAHQDAWIVRAEPQLRTAVRRSPSKEMKPGDSAFPMTWNGIPLVIESNDEQSLTISISRRVPPTKIIFHTTKTKG